MYNHSVDITNKYSYIYLWTYARLTYVDSSEKNIIVPSIIKDTNNNELSVKEIHTPSPVDTPVFKQTVEIITVPTSITFFYGCFSFLNNLKQVIFEEPCQIKVFLQSHFLIQI